MIYKTEFNQWDIAQLFTHRLRDTTDLNKSDRSKIFISIDSISVVDQLVQGYAVYRWWGMIIFIHLLDKLIGFSRTNILIGSRKQIGNTGHRLTGSNFIVLPIAGNDHWSHFLTAKKFFFRLRLRKTPKFFCSLATSNSYHYFFLKFIYKTKSIIILFII